MVGRERERERERDRKRDRKSEREIERERVTVSCQLPSSTHT